MPPSHLFKFLNYVFLLRLWAREWLIYVAFATRSAEIAAAVRNHRANLMLKRWHNNAAHVIQRFMKRWRAKNRRQKQDRAARTILRALRRNVLKRKLWRKKMATNIVFYYLNDALERSTVFMRIQLLRNSAIVIQRAWRTYRIIRGNVQVILGLQWLHAEERLMAYYKKMAPEDPKVEVPDAQLNRPPSSAKQPIPAAKLSDATPTEDPPPDPEPVQEQPKQLRTVPRSAALFPVRRTLRAPLLCSCVVLP